MAAKSKGQDAVKLFVGQIPKHMLQEELLPIFEEAGTVFEINIIKDKTTKQSRGCCFLTYTSRSEADTAIELFHNKRAIAPMNSPMQVKYADGELERLEHKLFIGMLPKSVTETEVREVFSVYGSIRELQIIKGSQQTAKACAFLKFETREQATVAVEALNGIYKMEGSTSALVVKWADTEKERQARKLQKSQAVAPAANGAVPGPQQPGSFGALPLATPQFNGFPYQAATYGMVPYSTTSIQNQQLISGVTAGNQSIPGALSELGSGVLTSLVQPTAYVNGAYPSVAGGQYPLAYQAPMMGQGVPGYANATSTPLVGFNSTPAPVKPVKANIAPQAEGPPGANLFIYHIPAEFGDTELSTAFASFGNVISAKVFVDKATGISKCFGFVSYDSPDAAQAAINVMNGFQMSGKRLKVQLKRDNKQNKPY